MKLKRFDIKGFRRILDASFLIGDASFLIGENNIGKSAILNALQIFHSGDPKLEDLDFFHDEKSDFTSEKVVMEAEYVDLPEEAESWKGFKGRVLKRKNAEGNEEKYILFKKEFPKDGKGLHYLKQYQKSRKAEYDGCKKAQEFIEKGIKKEEIIDVFGDISLDTNITVKKYESDLEELLSIWEFDYENSEWFQSPGGIVGNITSRLPRFLFIPAEDRKNDIDGKTGALQNIMKTLFEDVRDASENFANAQKYLNELSKELDPEDPTRDFGKMLGEINSIVGNVFPETGLHVQTELSDANKILHPHFNIEMSSNIRTDPERQGTGSVRSAAFALLRYRENFLERKAMTKRNLIIGFEEPEIYLHPNAANNMRDEIYNLAVSSTSQIICTTHSPYMIDLGKDIDKPKFPKQILNLLRLNFNEQGIAYTNSIPFNSTEAYESLINDERDKIKFLLKIDDYVARIFFVKNIVIVEGNTEEVVFRETVRRLPEIQRKKVQSEYQFVQARGKATIISLVKYLKAMGFQPFVVHDKDESEGATKFNQPILEALGNEESRIMLENCLEDVLGYEAPSNNKPYTAFQFIQENWKEENGWNGVGENWKKID
jgi:predicted ATP-dependent endonuclease of OLD family